MQGTQPIGDFYLSDPDAVSLVARATGLSEDELESIVGKFPNTHLKWPNLFKGAVSFKLNGNVEIRHHFTKKLLWRGKNETWTELSSY
jgi:hypothetical protein